MHFWSLNLDILKVSSLPLIMPGRKIVVSWSPKSGCTHVVVWFFIKTGLLQKANAYHDWPHNYRIDIYQKSTKYVKHVEQLKESDGKGYTHIKITRDPTKRLVSIFRHVCRHAFMHREFSRKLKLNAKRDGVSLLDLRSYLEGENLIKPSLINPHLCAQTHPVWDLSFDRTITLNLDQTELNAGINAIERDLGMGETPFADIPKFNTVREIHYAKSSEYDGPEPIEEHRFMPSETDDFPKQQLIESTILQQMAREFYAADFGKVDAGDTAGRLFTA